MFCSKATFFVLYSLTACERNKQHEPPGVTVNATQDRASTASLAPTPQDSHNTPNASASGLSVSSAGSITTHPIKQAQGNVQINLVFAGDAIPQRKVLANDIKNVLSGIGPQWHESDARVFNLEAPIGDGKSLPQDRSILAYASPPAWVQTLVAESKASTLVVANNHSCDLGPAGVLSTVEESEKIGVKISGASLTDPWATAKIIEKNGRTICLVSWTTFLNDKGRKQQACLDGLQGQKSARVAQAELGKHGNEILHRELGASLRWKGCDGRVAYIHGGGEYRAQIRPVIDQATVAAQYVDAVIVSHPHVPDGTEILSIKEQPTSTEGRPAGRKVPLFKSLGNFISNQGIAWTNRMSVSIVRSGDSPDPIRTVWTRVAVLAHLQFEWSGPSVQMPSTVRYAYSMQFTERNPVLNIRLRPLPDGQDDHIAKQLVRGPSPFGTLFSGSCLRKAENLWPCEAK